MKEKVGIGTGIASIPCEKNACCYGVHSSNIMKHDFSGDSSKEIIKSNSRINKTTTG
jgi:hypothetical protein